MPSARLWIVATPIGNPGELSPRAREVLKDAALVLAEDTRRAAILFAKAGIRANRLLSFFEHNERERQNEALAVLAAGNDVALVTDAGTPLIADPGFRLTQAAWAAGFRVCPVAGPSAPVAALSAAGIAPIPFSFLGFLPRGERARADLFASFAAVPGSLVFFERKDRLVESLAQAYAVLGNRDFAICRELTKEHEEFIFGKLAESARLAAALLGEITVIIGPGEKAAKTPVDEAAGFLREALYSGASAKEAAKAVRNIVSGWSRAELYDLALSLAERADK